VALQHEELHSIEPSKAPGEVRFSADVEYNARRGDITTLVPVVYGRHQLSPQTAAHAAARGTCAFARRASPAAAGRASGAFPASIG